jgi:hypothetical protein
MSRWHLTLAAFRHATVELSRADARKVLDNASYDYDKKNRSWLLYGPAGYVGRLECRGKR